MELPYFPAFVAFAGNIVASLEHIESKKPRDVGCVQTWEHDVCPRLRSL